MSPRHIFKILSLILIGIGLIVGIALLSGVVFLRSDSGQRFVLNRGQNFLASRFQIDFSYESGSFDLFSGLHFKNLRIVINQESLHADIEIPALDLQFAPHFLKRHFEIDEFKITRPSLKIIAKAISAKEESNADKSSNSLQSFIESPLVTVHLKYFVLENLEADIQTANGQVTVHDLNLSASLDIDKNFLGLDGDLNSGKPLLFKSPIGQAQVTASGNWALSLKKNHGHWIYEVQPTHFDLVAKNISAKTFLKVSEAKLLTKINLNATTEDLFEFQTIAFQTLDLDSKITAKGFFESTELTKPVNLDWSSNAVIAKDLSATLLKSSIRMNKIELAQVDAQMPKKEKSQLDRDFKGELKLFVNPLLTSLLKPTASLKRFANLEVKTSFEGHLHEDKALDLKTKTSIPNLKMHPKQSPLSLEWATDTKWNPTQNHLDLSSDLDLTSEDKGHWLIQLNQVFDHVKVEKPDEKSSLQAHGRAEITELQTPDEDHKLPMILLKPLTITDEFALKDGRVVRADATAELPLIDLFDFGNVTNTVASLKAKSTDLAQAKDLEIVFEMKQGDAPSLQVGMQARGNIQTQELQAHGDLALQITDDFPYVGKAAQNLSHQKLRGKITFPWTLAVIRGEEIDLKGLLSLNDVTWSSESSSVKGITGQIPISEKLKLRLKPGGHKLAFKDLIRQNAFERVDFERIRPLLMDSNPLRISEIHWEDKTYGPLVGFFEIHQNMVMAHQFDLDIGSGRVYGELSFDADPANLQLSLLSRLTSLNLNEILPSRYLPRKTFGNSENQNLSARAGLVLNLNTGTIDGRIDVTQIGGPQLITLVNLMDPRYANEKMNNLRQILALGYPTAAQAAFSEGYMDLDVDLSILGVPKSQSVRGVPMSSLISSKTSGLVQTIGEGYFP